MTIARRRGIDQLRRPKLGEQKYAQAGYERQAQREITPDLDAALDEDVGDDLLRLIFTARG
jgi:predicted RNA polymerase sigma factor